ncbi:MAG: NUDIX hydrolase [gamma proteobacterium symbiont of Taylorina sp.]|nr:NUDIX hydrolase [gamma proteobacterium symbiont of Taylorina sp.]
MLVTSSSNKHWVVPKGIIDPGLSALESAEKEALEEAGIVGSSHEELIGHYVCEKWGAQCSVEVYAMQVDRVLSELQWQESHRKRLWVDIDQAISRIHQPALIPLFKKLQKKNLS